MLIRCRTDGERDQNLIGMKARVMVTEVVDLELLYRLKDLGRDQLDLLGNAGHIFQGVKQASGRRAKQRRGLTRNKRTVWQFDG